MKDLFFLFLVTIILVFIIMSILFVESDLPEMSEMSYECGFEPFLLSRIPFSVHFFTITIVFLIFDLEIVIIFPMILEVWGINSSFMMTILVILLLLGLVIEWFDGAIDWLL